MSFIRRYGHVCVLQLAFVGAEQPKQWLSYLNWAEWHYNTSWHSAIKMTPFEAVYGRSPPSLLDYVSRSFSVASVEDLLQPRSTILLKLKENLLRAQNQIRNQENLKRTDVSFIVGDWECIGPVAFRLGLPSTTKIHNVFHVSLLKKCLGDHNSQITPLLGEFMDDHPILLPFDILKYREVWKQGKLVPQVLDKVPSDREANDAGQHVDELGQALLKL
ncbi:reverse transcriptase [Tanacetum coccineum]